MTAIEDPSGRFAECDAHFPQFANGFALASRSEPTEEDGLSYRFEVHTRTRVAAEAAQEAQMPDTAEERQYLELVRKSLGTRVQMASSCF